MITTFTSYQCHNSLHLKNAKGYRLCRSRRPTLAPVALSRKRLTHKLWLRNKMWPLDYATTFSLSLSCFINPSCPHSPSPHHPPRIVHPSPSTVTSSFPLHLLSPHLKSSPHVIDAWYQAHSSRCMMPTLCYLPCPCRCHQGSPRL